MGFACEKLKRMMAKFLSYETFIKVCVTSACLRAISNKYITIGHLLLYMCISNKYRHSDKCTIIHLNNADIQGKESMDSYTASNE